MLGEGLLIVDDTLIKTLSLFEFDSQIVVALQNCNFHAMVLVQHPPATDDVQPCGADWQKPLTHAFPSAALLAVPVARVPEQSEPLAIRRLRLFPN